MDEAELREFVSKERKYMEEISETGPHEALENTKNDSTTFCLYVFEMGSMRWFPTFITYNSKSTQTIRLRAPLGFWSAGAPFTEDEAEAMSDGLICSLVEFGDEDSLLRVDALGLDDDFICWVLERENGVRTLGWNLPAEFVSKDFLSTWVRYKLLDHMRMVEFNS